MLLSASPVLAADTMKPSSQPAGENAAGSDTSSGAKEQSSAPPGSPAESDLSNKSSMAVAISKIQERYGYAKDQARKEVDDWYSGQQW
jgi:hypothetical protein